MTHKTEFNRRCAFPNSRIHSDCDSFKSPLEKAGSLRVKGVLDCLWPVTDGQRQRLGQRQINGGAAAAAPRFNVGLGLGTNASVTGAAGRADVLLG